MNLTGSWWVWKNSELEPFWRNKTWRMSCTLWCFFETFSSMTRWRDEQHQTRLESDDVLLLQHCRYAGHHKACVRSNSTSPEDILVVSAFSPKDGRCSSPQRLVFLPSAHKLILLRLQMRRSRLLRGKLSRVPSSSLHTCFEASTFYFRVINKNVVKIVESIAYWECVRDYFWLIYGVINVVGSIA